MAGRGVTGFTLVELVLVMIVIGILAVFAAPRLQIGGFQQYTFDRELRAALRQAQKVAIGSACEVEVVVDSGGYSVQFTGEGGDVCEAGPLRHPSRSGAFAGEPEGEAAVVQGGSVTFDGRGNTGDTPVVFELSGSRIIRVEAETGYVHEG